MLLLELLYLTEYPKNVCFSLMYDPTMDAHFTKEVFYGAVLGITIDPHPESPARTQAVWSGMVEAGITEDAEVTMLPNGRMLTK